MYVPDGHICQEIKTPVSRGGVYLRKNVEPQYCFVYTLKLVGSIPYSCPTMKPKSSIQEINNILIKIPPG